MHAGNVHGVDFRPYDARAVELAVDIAESITDDQWHLRTPCPPWTVRDLLGHMVGQNLRFAAAVRGEDADAVCPLDGGDLGADPAATFRASARTVEKAFAEARMDTTVSVPELAPMIPARRLVGAHFLDFMAHQWDLGVSVGQPRTVPDDMTQAVLRLAEGLPEAARNGPEAAFGPVVDAPHAGDFDRFLQLVGRDPRWPLPTGAG